MKSAVETRMEQEAKLAEMLNDMADLLIKMHGDKEAISEDRLEMVKEELAEAVNNKLEVPAW